KQRGLKRRHAPDPAIRLCIIKATRAHAGAQGRLYTANASTDRVQRLEEGHSVELLYEQPLRLARDSFEEPFDVAEAPSAPYAIQLKPPENQFENRITGKIERVHHRCIERRVHKVIVSAEKLVGTLSI